jgi:serine protease AprX
MPLPVVDLDDTVHGSKPSGINQIFAQNNSEVILYPNPNHGEFNLSFDMAESNQVKLNVYDIDGRAIYLWQAPLSAGVQNLEINLNRSGVVAPGIYFYRLEAGSSVYNGKISVTNE